MTREQQRIAIAEAVGKDADYLKMEFTNQLVAIVCSARGFRWDKGNQDDHLMCLSHATASQRAEAFLRTIGKWEEGK